VGSVKAAATVALVLLASVLVGCGGGGDQASSTTTAPTTTATQAQAGHGSGKVHPSRGAEPEKGNGPKTRGASPPNAHRGDSGAAGAQQFHHNGSDNSIQESGSEAAASDRDRAAAALHGYLDAGVRRDWASACHLLARAIYEQLAAGIGLPGQPCPTVLGRYFAHVVRARFALAAVAEVGSLRLEGDHGFLLYHGAEDVDYAMPMAMEGGRWKVAAAAATALP
jgi:hypothetical protein